MGWGSHLAEGLKPVVDLVYPPRCPLCGDATGDQGGVCSECWGELIIPGEPSCASCGRPFGSERMGHEAQCAPCLTDPPKHSGIVAATIYNDASRKLILTFKHGGKIALAGLLGRLLAARLPDAGDDNAPLLVPVPLHRWRLWQRGFNQSGLIAQELAKRGKGELLVDGLVRRKRTPSLGGLGAKARHKTLAGAIGVRPSRMARIKGRDIVLVDDVLTSGATSDACVQTLLKGGARSVTIACFARVIEGEFDSSVERMLQKSEPENTTPEAITTPGAT